MTSKFIQGVYWKEQKAIGEEQEHFVDAFQEYQNKERKGDDLWINLMESWDLLLSQKQSP